MIVKERFTVEAPQDMVEALRREATGEHLSLSAHIRRIFIAHLRKKEEVVGNRKSRQKQPEAKGAR